MARRRNTQRKPGATLQERLQAVARQLASARQLYEHGDVSSLDLCAMLLTIQATLKRCEIALIRERLERLLALPPSDQRTRRTEILHLFQALLHATG